MKSGDVTGCRCAIIKGEVSEVKVKNAEKNKTMSVYVRMLPALSKDLDKICEQDRTDRAAMMRTLVTAEVKRRSEYRENNQVHRVTRVQRRSARRNRCRGYRDHAGR